jgi:thiamine biosynthesis lipoprotein
MPLILLIWLIVLGGIWKYTQGGQASKTGFSMGTVISETIYGRGSDTAVEEVLTLIQNLDEKDLSWREDESAIAVLNQQLATATEAEVSERTAQYIQDSLSLCKASGGALDITIHPLIELWGIESDTPAIPSEDLIQKALDDIGYEEVHVTDATHIQTDVSGLSIDLGAVGKGVAADEVCTYLNQQNADSASDIHVQGAVVSIGGTVLVYGKKSGNQAWQVGIRNPRGSQDSSLGYLSLKETTVVSTSGDYEQYFEEDGVRYHHIFNPSTGYPADSGLMSVTVVCKQGIYSDGLSTACFILGYEDSLPLLEQYDAEAVFVTTDAEVLVTDGLKDSFTLTNDDFVLR